MKSEIKKKLEESPKSAGKVILTIVILTLFLAWAASVLNFNNTSASGLQVAKNIITGILQPNLDMLFNLTKAGVPYLLLETACIAFLGTLIGAIISVPIAFVSANNLLPKPFPMIGQLITIVIRTVPAFVYGLMFIRVVGPGAFAGLLTMSLTSVGMITKMYIDTIEDLDMKILESLRAAGCNIFEQIRYGILPQLFSNFSSTVIYRFDVNLRDAAVLGLVGAGGIGAPLIFAMNSYRWSEVGAILAGLIVFVLAVEYFSTKIRLKLVKG